MTALIFCENCGAGNQPDRTVCFSCGLQLSDADAAIVPAPRGLLPPHTLLKQRYRILHSIGQGGMGAVYQAEDLQLGNRLVAVKEMAEHNLSPQEIANAADNFKREAHLLASLQHANLPSIHDYFTEAGRWYLVMSFIQGDTLHHYLAKKGGKLPMAESLQIGIALCTVLDYLHTRKPPIIFRDLKPANIIRAPDGQIFLIDFGIARHFKPGQAKDTSAFGSAGYAAPEQYGRAQTTPRSDIYSLGVILYQMLAGWDPSLAPFRFPLLHTQKVNVPATLDTLIMSMLDMDAEKRPRSMQAVRQELQRAATTPPAQPSRIAPTVAAPWMTGMTSAAAPLPESNAAPRLATLKVPVPPVLPRLSAFHALKWPTWKLPAFNISLRRSPAPQLQPVARRQPLQLAQAASALVQRANRNLWSFSWRQIIATLLGAILCGLITVWLDHGTFPTWYRFVIGNVSFRISLFLLMDMVTLTIALFYGALWGPWSGLFVGGVGTLLGDYLVFSGKSFGWPWDLRVALAGFIVGLLLLKLRPSRAVFCVMNAAAILLSTAFASYTDMWLHQQSNSEAGTIFVVYSAISILSCLTLLSFLYNRYKQHRHNFSGF